MSELLGCDAVGCPVDEYRIAQCKVGNATLKAVGIANVTTIADTRPFTWTLGLQERPSAGNGPQITFDRNFYLGTPPSLQLNGTTGCALFFEGIAANLTVPEDKVDSFTCSDVLNKDCVSDLITQAQLAVKAGEPAKDSDFCNEMRESLVDKPPSTSLTGDKPLEKTDQSQCRPTTGQNYDLSLVTSQQQQSSSRELEQLAPVLYAITPVMTIFRKGDDTKAGLTCLKLVESKANQTTDDTKPQGSSAGINTPFMAYFALVSLTLVFVL
ncbi:uncharacterized protein BP5553_05987 [Venustampulla echinocandica]|uniref:Uncharacterized protein n=1 Tax=Venustampulla echinocandica TaxID=2656787 RepID=A0A370TMA0_9HELO|nr:uncharacterized protein BP5553_05987 [Venustampulla echinocandica]RDL36635.1 hypothetical protein BP5553_05987 [Venustampulla echinocandica]